MQTKVLQVDPEQPDPAAIALAAKILVNGGLVAFPTETVYGLGANALRPDAVSRIFAAKGRPATNPVIVHISQEPQARSLVTSWPENAVRLANHFWPGPLTIVLPRSSMVPETVTAGGPTVAIRMPGHPVALALLRAAGIPLAAPSANRSTYLSPTRPEHVLDGLDGRIDLLIDSGPTSGGIESTVVDLTTVPPRILRPGLISLSQLESEIGSITLARTETDRSSTEAARSPGLMNRHYAPRTPLECLSANSWIRAQTYLSEGLQVGWLTMGPAPDPQPTRLHCIEMPSDPNSYAAQLYSHLHLLDKFGVERILVDLPPDTPAWAAVRDRLKRATAHKESD
jgi:L-threonylcarbamoyladenylate synthase